MHALIMSYKQIWCSGINTESPSFGGIMLVKQKKPKKNTIPFFSFIGIEDSYATAVTPDIEM